jgi:AcrR family transcriptional regulator
VPRAQAPRTRTPSADVTESLLDAALALLTEGGSDAITVRDVATRAGVAPMGVYTRFGGKDGLLEALFLDGFSRLQAAITAARGSDARSRLRNGCLAYRRFGVENPHLYELMFRQMLELELSAESLEQAERTFGHLVERVEDAAAAGAIRADDAVDVAQQIWNALHGTVSLEIAGVTFSSDPESTFAKLIDTLIAGLSR